MHPPSNEECPLCGKTNNCCNGKDKSLGICWCSQETFPNGIFELIPENDIRVKCICKECLNRYKSGTLQ
ncbi:cysteine-rich CWC family protein [Sporosarcina thermotolerans]|uniref:Cysteine-rich CWC family protein n=1 Tax=Sporosarcina thermotolerans TaxID=633404 RepID=A0AAW9A8T5_9BACL|nr:cysteine-rich CWC family protein [Sporosarcina thermotolerans]MDW0117459.1 cysteine-rich CWC family protein [Sporosarcina thermotolerans]